MATTTTLTITDGIYSGISIPLTTIAVQVQNNTNAAVMIRCGATFTGQLAGNASAWITNVNTFANFAGWLILRPKFPPGPQGTTITITAYGSSDGMPFPYIGGVVLPNVQALQSTNLPLVYNVRDFGAVGDGVTNDTSAIQAAITAASALGGGLVYLPANTYSVTSLILANNVCLQGDGIINTTLQLRSGTNADLLWGGSANAALINLAAPFGTSQTSGPPIVQDFKISDMTLDGNRAGQTGGPSYCLRGYFVEYALENVRLKNGYTGGVLTDWNGSGIPTGSNSVESSWHNVKVHDCGGIGLEFGGPSDSVFQDVVIYNTGSHALHIAPNAGGTMMTNVHCWGMATGVSAVGMLIESGFNYFAGCEAEGSDTCQLVLLSESNEWVGGATYASGGATACVGVQLGQQAGLTPYPGSILQSAGLTTAALAQSNMVEGRITECRNGAVNFVNSAYNHVIVRNNQASGTVIAGTRGATDTLMLSSRFGDNDLYSPTAFGVGQASTAQAVGNGWTIGSGGVGAYRAAPTANATGVIIQAGVSAGQVLYVVNESAFSITMAAAATSHVADGVSCVIAALGMKAFVWDSGTALWYHN